jgi:uncharacterized protein (TIGR02001 family)
MKKTVLIIAALAAVGVSYAQNNVNVTTKPSYSVTSDFSYTSEYVFRGIKNSNAAFQSSLEVGQDDVRVGVWTSQPIDSRGDNNEIDFYAGYKLRLSKELSADFVGTYYYYPESTGTQTHHSYELGVGGTYDLGAINPGFAGVSASLYYYYDFRLEQQTIQGSLGYSFALKDYGTSLDFSVFAGTSSGHDLAPDAPSGAREVEETYNYGGIGLNIPYRLAENAQVHVGASYAVTQGYLDWRTTSNLPPRRTIAVNAGVTLGF